MFAFFMALCYPMLLASLSYEEYLYLPIDYNLKLKFFKKKSVYFCQAKIKCKMNVLKMGRMKRMDMSKYRVDPERKMRLSDYPQWEDAGYTKEELTEKMITENVEKLRDLQLRLHAEEEKVIFVILQAIDTAGKDEIITFIFSHLMPQGLKVTPTKKPTEEELKHDFLWRIHAGKPERGQIGILNRSYYEDLLAP